MRGSLIVISLVTSITNNYVNRIILIRLIISALNVIDTLYFNDLPSGKSTYKDLLNHLGVGI